MNDSFKDQYDAFFKDFKGLAQRMERVFPNPPTPPGSVTKPKIDYEFVCVTQQKDVVENNALIKLFFDDLYDKDECFFSGVREGRKTAAELVAQVPGNGVTADVCTFFVIGFRPSIHIATSPERPLTGCIVHYFTSSRTMLIESIWISDDLPEIGMRISERQNDSPVDYQSRKKAALSWLLTYNGPLSDRLEKIYTDQTKQLPRKRTSGLYKLVDKVEKERIHAPGALVVREGGEVKGQMVRRHVINDRIAGIFHETLDPVCLVDLPVEGQYAAETQAAVLRTFHDAEAKFLKFGYRQPSYKSAACKHLLLTFSQVVRKPDYITLESGIVMAFIVDYAKYFNPRYDAPLGSDTRDSRYRRDLNECWHFLPDKERIPGLTGAPEDGGYFIPENSQALFFKRFSDHATVIYLNNVPRIEEPRFSYRRASISFEISVDEDYFPPLGLDRYHVLEGEGTLFCPLMHSTETDLFAYKYQSTPPYFSRNYGSRLMPVLISFPLYSEFISEGRKEIYFRLPKRGQDAGSLSSAGDAEAKEYYQVKMLAGVSYTYFRDSSLRIWHLVLRPFDDTSELNTQISELELIKLMRFFSGSQEFESEEQRHDTVRQIRFQVLSDENPSADDLSSQPNTDRDNLIDLLAQLTGVTYHDAVGSEEQIRLLKEEDRKVNLRKVSSGVVQIDTGNVTSTIDNYDESNKLGKERYDADDFLGFYGADDSRQPSPEDRFYIRKTVKDFYENLNENKIETPEEEAEPYSVADYADYVFKAYCGMSLGIFDYDRMGLQEIDDTLVPLPDSKTEKSFLVIHRGVLAMFGNDDNVLDSFWSTLGMNPYHVIPSAVLAHNDYVARDVEIRLAELMLDEGGKKRIMSIKEINIQRNYIDKLLNQDMLGDVFQYKTEQELYKEGMERRGITQRINDCRVKLDQLDKRIESMHKERTASYENIIQLLLAAATLTGVIPLLKESRWVRLDDVEILALFTLFVALWFAKGYFSANNYAPVKRLFRKLIMLKYIDRFRRKYFPKSVNVQIP